MIIYYFEASAVLKPYFLRSKVMSATNEPDCFGDVIGISNEEPSFESQAIDYKDLRGK